VLIFSQNNDRHGRSAAGHRCGGQPPLRWPVEDGEHCRVHAGPARWDLGHRGQVRQHADHLHPGLVLGRRRQTSVGIRSGSQITVSRRPSSPLPGRATRSGNIRRAAMSTGCPADATSTASRDPQTTSMR